MPELAEVHHYAHRWDTAVGQAVRKVRWHPKARVFRRFSGDLPKLIEGSVLTAILTHGKQMCFRFTGGDAWLGVHLGMSGSLILCPLPYAPDKHDHLVLETATHALVFKDPRMFGEVRCEAGAQPPAWWSDLPPECLSDSFDQALLDAFLKRRGKAPLKAVLLMQETFPGVGNWMADEILWRARIHPADPAGSLPSRQTPDPPRQDQGGLRRCHARHRQGLGRGTKRMALQPPLAGRRHLPRLRGAPPARGNRRPHHLLEPETAKTGPPHLIGPRRPHPRRSGPCRG